MNFGIKPSKEHSNEVPFYFRDLGQGKTQTIPHVFRTGGGLNIGVVRNFSLCTQVCLRRGAESPLVLETLFMRRFPIVKRVPVRITQFDQSYSTVFKLCHYDSRFFVFYHEQHPIVEVRSLISLKVVTTCGLEGIFSGLDLNSKANELKTSIDVTYIPFLEQFALAIGSTVVLAKDSAVKRIIYDAKLHNAKERFTNISYDNCSNHLLVVGTASIVIFQLDSIGTCPARTLPLDQSSYGRGARFLGWIHSESLLMIGKTTPQLQEIINI